MPTTCPARSSSGPPELPGLTAASTWMRPSYRSSVSGSMNVRSRPETTPTVSVPYRPNGLPTTYASLPIRSAPGLPRIARGHVRREAHDLEDGDVGGRVAGHDGGGRGRAVGPGDVDVVGTGNDVERGEDLATVVDEHARAAAATLTRPGITRRLGRVALGRGGARPDEDEGRANRLVDELRGGRRGRLRGERRRDGVGDVLVCDRRRARLEGEEQRAEEHHARGTGEERRGVPKPRRRLGAARFLVRRCHAQSVIRPASSIDQSLRSITFVIRCLQRWYAVREPPVRAAP